MAAPQASQTRRRERGFTVIEILVALTVLALGIAGIMSIQMTALRATAYNRHAAEASVLAEDRMELLRAQPAETLADGEDQVDALGIPGSDGFYRRRWTAVSNLGLVTIEVSVAWYERGSEEHSFTMVTQRSLR
jgi:prepilin-type N-terminal cleavage/methylation domain-containing protein